MLNLGTKVGQFLSCTSVQLMLNSPFLTLANPLNLSYIESLRKTDAQSRSLRKRSGKKRLIFARRENKPGSRRLKVFDNTHGQINDDDS